MSATWLAVVVLVPLVAAAGAITLIALVSRREFGRRRGGDRRPERGG